MDVTRPILDHVNLVSGDPEAAIAFYRRLGVRIPEAGVWRTTTGPHHANATDPGGADIDFAIDSADFAAIWNSGWRGRGDLHGRIVLGFRLPSREAVDTLYAAMTGAGHPGLQPPYDAFWGARYAVVEDPDGVAVGLMSPSASELRSDPPQV